MLPPLTDLLALLGINLVLCAGCLKLCCSWRGSTQCAKLATAACFCLLWVPVGAAHLPLVAYVRGISSDLSVTLVGLACMGLAKHLLGWATPNQREKAALNGVVAAAALFLYPLALGWGDWDAYRAGWGSYGMWLVLLALVLGFWMKGLRLLPVLLGLSLFAWSVGSMESTNMWDYLLDPWLATAAIFQSLQWSVRRLLSQFRPVVRG